MLLDLVFFKSTTSLISSCCNSSVRHSLLMCKSTNDLFCIAIQKTRYNPSIGTVGVPPKQFEVPSSSHSWAGAMRDYIIQHNEVYPDNKVAKYISCNQDQSLGRLAYFEKEMSITPMNISLLRSAGNILPRG